MSSALTSSGGARLGSAPLEEWRSRHASSTSATAPETTGAESEVPSASAPIRVALALILSTIGIGSTLKRRRRQEGT